LPEPFVQDNADRGGKVETADRTLHRNPVATLGVLFQDTVGHALGLVAEDQARIRGNDRVPERVLGPGREVETAITADRIPNSRHSGWFHGHVPVVESGAAEIAIFQGESEPTDQVTGVGCGAESGVLPVLGWICGSMRAT
jgi:hypothetical protein